MKTLSIKQPWAQLIAIGLKDIENRSWPTSYRGKILIHASLKIIPGVETAGQLLTHQQYGKLIFCDKMNLANIMTERLCTGAIIGSVEIVDCVQNHYSVWAEKNTDDKPIYNWVLKNAVLFKEPVLIVKGSLSLWNYDLPDYVL